jgi:long-chain acyl-CoA synthetase
MDASASAPSGLEASTGSKTIADLLPLAAERYGDRVAVKFKREGTWHDLTVAQVATIAQEIGLGLVALGVQPGDRVSILCRTRPEWTYCDFGATEAGTCVVPIYPTNSPEECEWVLADSGARVVICEDAAPTATPKSSTAASPRSSRTIRSRSSTPQARPVRRRAASSRTATTARSSRWRSRPAPSRTRS